MVGKVSRLAWGVVLVCAGCAGFASAPSRQAPRQIRMLMPVDDASIEASLMQARGRLMDALTRNDPGALAALISPNLHTAKHPVEVLEHAGEARASILKALRFGGAFTTERGSQVGRREFCAPYVYARYPDVQDREPWFAEQPGGILGRDVAAHERPSASSPVAARLTYAIVRSEGTVQGDDVRGTLWVLIGLPDRDAYVLASDIWRPDEYHVCFAQEGTQWLVSQMSREVLSR
jgi:hypothetical protein